VSATPLMALRAPTPFPSAGRLGSNRLNGNQLHDGVVDTVPKQTERYVDRAARPQVARTQCHHDSQRLMQPAAIFGECPQLCRFLDASNNETLRTISYLRRLCCRRGGGRVGGPAAGDAAFDPETLALVEASLALFEPMPSKRGSRSVGALVRSAEPAASFPRRGPPTRARAVRESFPNSNCRQVIRNSEYVFGLVRESPRETSSQQFPP
jgi:hypothetical protein